MFVRSSVPAFALVLLASFLGAACSSGGSTSIPSGDPDEENVEESEDALGADCTYSRKWFATLRDRACQPVVGYRGRWVPSPLFEETRDDKSTCTYSWQGEKYSRADQRALEASATEGEGLAPACGPGKNPVEGELIQIEQLDVIGMAGSAGCDVCGILIGRNDRINVILPPGKIISKQLAVRMSNGESRSFQLSAPEGARAVSFQLPPPPTGAYYLPTKVSVY
jgi:hypothetical protein